MSSLNFSHSSTFPHPVSKFVSARISTPEFSGEEPTKPSVEDFYHPIEGRRRFRNGLGKILHPKKPYSEMSRWELMWRHVWEENYHPDFKKE